MHLSHHHSGSQGIQRPGDGKDCALPGSSGPGGVRWACLAIFFLALGLGEVCTGDAWNLPFGGNRRSGVFPAGQSSRRDQRTGTGPFRCTRVSLHEQTRSPRTPSAPPPPPRRFSQTALSFFGSLEKKPSGRHERTRLHSAETGATAALDASAPAADRRYGIGGGPASQP